MCKLRLKIQTFCLGHQDIQAELHYVQCILINKYCSGRQGNKKGT